MVTRYGLHRMRYKITAPSHLDTIVNLPASKSISNRALTICALAASDGSRDATALSNLSDCDDTEVIVKALNSMPDTFDIGAAGTAMRFMTAYLSVTPGTRSITGTERMRHRPIGVLVDALRRLGAHIEYVGEEGFPPLRIAGGQLDGGYLDIPGTISSQYISALLLIAPAMRHGLTLQLTGAIVSRPYIDLTISVMRDFGASVEWTDHDTIHVEALPYTKRAYTIENDWSAASYWYEMMALSAGHTGMASLTGLHDGSCQGDAVIRYIFSMLGVKTTFCGDAVRLTKIPVRLKKLEYDFKNQPDMAQTFVVTCAALGIPFRFIGLHNLRIKETDRIEAVCREMGKLGYVVSRGDGSELAWDGSRCQADEHPVIDTYDDHRMAMAFAPMSLRLPSISINNPRVVTKSYPRYWDDLRKAGFAVEEVKN